ncbi:MAG TPA: diacylglycerol kinase family protein [Chthoniobacterales bacterium]|nr:diacylglycerol kinase family protein [Chthoniobacterales bacterium]
MRILLVHNPDAGDEEAKPDELIKTLARAGHEVVYQSSKKEQKLKRALKSRLDLVLVAGGDGTLGKVARQLVGRKLPLSVLPSGTANNLARTFGFWAPAKELIGQLAKGERTGFDVGRARGPWGKWYLFEALGAGLLADHLYQHEWKDQEEKSGSPAEQMRRHVRELRRRVRNHPARAWKIELDGKDFSGRYLLWQAMNIRSVGPVLTLAPQAAPDDGQFDFVERGKMIERSSSSIWRRGWRAGNRSFPCRAIVSKRCVSAGKRGRSISMTKSGRRKMRNVPRPAQSSY